ncbi:hypothetical protein NDU88_004862 [Pleurodeles waltl]|uniref:Uncharacterized protein n=1 Tax=Pleurodeles waltl TaxID=8319 RepID=A0AAV7T8N5_PLEWA|nr:hypothetical protein NDU88_004862 [Pleurodeles waltl]
MVGGEPVGTRSHSFKDGSAHQSSGMSWWTRLGETSGQGSWLPGPDGAKVGAYLECASKGAQRSMATA